MKRKTNRLLSFIFALVLMVGLLPISVFATENNYTDDDLSEALEAYKKFTEGEYHEDEWTYTIESFGLYDLNHDGIPELFTLGGGRMDYCKIFTYKNGEVSYVHWGSDFSLYDNGLIQYGFSGGFGYHLTSYYELDANLEFNLVFRFAEWPSWEGTTYSIGEQAHDENSEKVPYSQIEETLAGILGDAKPVEIEFHGNNAAERSAVFSSGAAEVKSYFEAYLKVLEENRNGILKYNWQKNDYGKKLTPIAFVDILGDNTPELLFVAAEPPDYYWATLYIYTYENEFAHQVFSQFIAGGAGGTLHYTIFQANENFWIQQTRFSIEGRSVWNTRYEFDKTTESLSPAETCSSAKAYHYSSDYSTQISSYTWKHNESEITESEYNEAITELDNSISSLILKDGITHMSVTTEAPISTYPHEPISMTYDEAVEYLSSNGEVVSTADNTAEDNSYNLERFFQNSDLGKGNNELARIAADLSIKTYDNGGLNAESVEGCLIYDLGFEKKNIYSSDYGYEGNILSSHSSFAYTIATKEYKGRNSDGNTDILVIVARGTMSIRELGGDAFTGTGGAYRNYEVYDIVDRFTQAIFSGVYKVVDRNKNYKVLLTGHSLGGAAVNLAAAKLIDKSINNVKIKNPITDVVCYTFGAIDSIVTDGTISKGYENIHNITNFHDSFGPDGWPIFTAKGNTRYGKFGHIDMFWNDIDKGAFGSRKNHDMSTYLEAVQTGIIDYERASNQKIVAWHCPIDIDVYKNDLLVGRVVNDEVISSVTTIPISIVDGSKYMLLTDEEEYTFIVTATDTGTMTFSCRDTATGNDAKIFTDVALEAGKTMTSTVGGEIETLDVKLYVVNDEGAPIAEVQEDGTEAPIEQIAAVNATTEVLEDSTEAAVKQNGKFVILLMGIGSIVLIGLVVLFLLKRRNRNKKGL